MPMSFDGHAASSSGCGIKPKVLGIGSTAFVGRTGISSRTGSYAMATAEHREPCDSRRSCTVLGAPGGESPPGDSTTTGDQNGQGYGTVPSQSCRGCCALHPCSKANIKQSFDSLSGLPNSLAYHPTAPPSHFLPPKSTIATVRIEANSP